MERDERYEINSEGTIVIGQPVTLTRNEKKALIEEMFSINGWEYSLLNEVTSAHYIIQLKNDNLQIEKTIHLYHGNVRKEDPDRNREEKKIQLGTENDPRTNMDEGIILGFYVYENKNTLENAVIVAWPIEPDKNYPANPSLRVNMKTDILLAKNLGFHVDSTTGKRLVMFRPEFIYHYIENYKKLHYPELDVENTENQQNDTNIKFETGYESEKKFSRNRILFGAPGTGKSFTLNKEKDELLADGGEFERVTFHPDYSYANFVGTYKPVPCKDSDGKDAITYEYVPGPFMRTYVKALENSKTAEPKPFLLIVEEINRANVAAVFGDVFQLLDRDNSEVSEYPVQASEDIKKHLVDKLGGNLEDYAEIRIPDNMFIWATMNSADQGVFPMDTAFKRRWNFDYLGINHNEDDIKGNFVSMGSGVYHRAIEWNELRKTINNTLSSYKINEDKLLGPYFLSRKIVVPNAGNEINANIFISAFKSKVLMYLFDDAAKQKRASLFDGCMDTTKYSSICEEFDKRGVEIFCKEIRDKFPRAIATVAESPEEYK
ncbi:AAA family ATPase [Bacillus altitudinis]|uniref:AAA family ATPase n=1 Tax=Bacillus altitudinis TaxID=293387 RepID=UPI0024809506|nr:AAA family ATPase [Bacillus altitudinis]